MADRSQLEARVRSAAEFGFRVGGMATSPLRPPPEFIGIGGKRCGSTSLHFGLLQHPAILPLFPSADRLPMKEHRKWVRSLGEGQKSRVWYRSHFASAPARRRLGDSRGPAVTGETTPWYLFADGAAEEAARQAPEARILVVLRDPVERAWSHFNEQRRRDQEPLEDFADALDAEVERRRVGVSGPNGCTAAFAHEHLTYRLQGNYVHGLRPWTERFERVLVLRSEDFYRDTPAVLAETAEFLGVGPHTFVAERRNATKPSPRPDPGVLAELKAHYGPLNAELEELVGRPMGWD